MPAPTILSTDSIPPLESVFNSIGANGLNLDIAARAFKTYKVANFDALSVLSTVALVEGDQADNAAADCTMRWNGTVWVQITEATFTTTGNRDTEYARASGAFKVAGSARAFISGIPEHEEWIGSVWASLVAVSLVPAQSRVIPSAANTSATVTLGTNGVITAITASDVRFTAFSAAGANYALLYSISAVSATAVVAVQLCSALTPVTAGYIADNAQIPNTATAISGNATTTTELGIIRADATLGAGGKLEIQSPFLTRRTHIQNFGSDNTITTISGGVLNDALSHDGLRIFIPAGGTFSGEFRLYMWNDN